jgi:hypothetical protein
MSLIEQYRRNVWTITVTDQTFLSFFGLFCPETGQIGHIRGFGPGSFVQLKDFLPPVENRPFGGAKKPNWS